VPNSMQKLLRISMLPSAEGCPVRRVSGSSPPFLSTMDCSLLLIGSVRVFWHATTSCIKHMSLLPHPKIFSDPHGRLSIVASVADSHWTLIFKSHSSLPGVCESHNSSPFLASQPCRRLRTSSGCRNYFLHPLNFTKEKH
jgi:hypothetical protein